MAKQAQAIRIHNYGGPEELKLEQAQIPEPQADEVLVRVHAVGVNPVDWKITEGWLKDFRPVQFPYIPGRDIAGIVEEVGPGVTAFQKGQAVFGQSARGGYTEYIPASVNTLALKPDALSFEEAAAIPVGATTAWQGLFDHGNLQPGQTVLVQGASGGVGLFVVQFAHWKGAHVIATTSSSNIDFVRLLGADTVIDYKSESVDQTVHDADLVFDTVGAPTLASSLKALKNGGTLVTIAGQPEEAQVKEKNARVERFSAQVSHDLLETFTKLIQEGQLKVELEATYPLADAAQAHQRSKTGHGRGRIVLKVTD
ncbi:oxidoreductase [Dictyobacter sp. S3.2.2.5]|uniref:Oxidoreductase n=1 Tax=Dictyobacter halimunensis TaxID=3026934 RepID=A0ABQ6FM89_9CHLR|nr:oxidoreductase [Dictyobacter sp. S3.2.2.5]